MKYVKIMNEINRQIEEGLLKPGHKLPSITIELPKPLKAKQLIEHLEQEHVYVDDASKMFLPEFAKDTVLRLSVSQVKEELIHRGVQKIAHGITSLIIKNRQVNAFRWI